jgi:hypothetical protein
MNLRYCIIVFMLLVTINGKAASAQCNVPEVVKGADKYNELVCKAYAATKNGNREQALDLFLAASRENIFESPNVLLFGDIAKTYASLGQFENADKYLKYDNITVLWMIGIIRCHHTSDSSDNEVFVKDGKPLTSPEAKYMVNAVCGELYDDYSYFRDRNAESFVPAAKAILRYSEIRKEIDEMRAKRSSR